MLRFLLGLTPGMGATGALVYVVAAPDVIGAMHRLVLALTAVAVLAGAMGVVSVASPAHAP